MLCSTRLQFTGDGASVAVAHGERVALVGRTGGSHTLVAARVTAIAGFGDQVWTVNGRALRRWRLDGREIGEPVEVAGAGALVPAFAGPPAAALIGESTRAWFDDLGTLREIEIAGRALPFAGRRTVGVAGRTVRLGAAAWQLPVGAQLAGAAALFDGAGVALVLRHGAGIAVWSSSTTGVVHHRVTLPADGMPRLAARRGILLACAGGRITAIDLRSGRPVGAMALEGDDVAIDPDGEHIAVRDGDRVRFARLRDAVARASLRDEHVAQVEAADEPAQVAPREPVQVAARVAPAAPDEPRGVVRDEDEAVERRRVIDRPLVLRGLAPRRGVRVEREEAIAALDDELQLVALRATVAIARGWDTRRIGYGNESEHPYEHEVAAIVGLNHGFATGHLGVARAQLAAWEARLGAQRRGPGSAIGALAEELGLSALAVDLLLVIAAPVVRGELARLYGILANDPNRPLVDELLVAQVLGASPHDVARELDPRAQLVRSGAVQVGDGVRLFAGLTVDPVVLARLRAEPAALDGAVVRRATVQLEELAIGDQVLRAAIAQLSRENRIALRGRPGSGRRTTLAALAAEAGRDVGVIDAAALPREGLGAALKAALRRVHLAGMVPCVVEVERVQIEVVREVLAAHAGAVAVAVAPETEAPLEAGHVVIELAALDETARLARWKQALARSGHWVRNVEEIAARYRVGPGVIERAIGAIEGDADDATEAIEAYVRQTRDARIGASARRVERLASWANLVLPPDVMDSLRELVGRVRHRRRVYEEWGLGATLQTARGITALFQGQPGTGKTLVAGVIARELGLDLYQVDLSKIMSKWIGETERNLAAVFDAAEDGQVILLFDEADSLFAKRTEVRSSNDRYANLEVNYLLQRLDAFEGIAILTTNFGGSIDPAFKRRLTFRLSLPFPDEETRTQLWRCHLPAQLPVAGELALEGLARKYQLAGGYIRNACVRAAFLAAQAEGPLRHEHLERAVALEMTEAGKLSSSGAVA